MPARQHCGTWFAGFPPRKRSLGLLWVVACFLALAPQLWAQTFPALSQQAWSTDEGLPDASVHAVLQARDGYLWIATEGGIARFDGVSFDTFPAASRSAFPSRDVSSIAQDGTGALWFGTADGVVRFAGGTFQHFAASRASRVLDVAAGRGSLLALTPAGVAAWNGAGFVSVPGTPPDVDALQPLPDGSIALLARSGAVRYGPGGTLQRLGGGGGSTTDPLLALAEDHEAEWLLSAGMLRLHTRSGEREWTSAHDFGGARLTALLLDREGRTWIGTRRGLYLLPSAATAGPPQHVELLARDSILSLLEDREGNVWVGTEESGLHVLRPRKFQTVASTLGENMTAVVPGAQGDLWLGTRDAGLLRLDHGVLSTPIPSAMLTSPVLLSLAVGKEGELWAGTPDGLNRVTGRTVLRITSAEGLPDDFVRSVMVDPHGVVWAGTRRGLARLDSQGVRRTLTVEDGLGSNSIGPLLPGESRGGEGEADNVWIGTSNGLSHLVSHRVHTVVPPPDSGSAVITALAQAPGENALLVGIHGAGLWWFDGVRFHRLPLPGLPAQVVAIVVDREGFAWIRGSHGVFRVAAGDLRRCEAQPGACGAHVDAMGTADGLPSDSAAADGSPQMALAPSGWLWVVTQRGVAVADTAQLPVNLEPPLVALQSFTVDGSSLPLNPGDLTIGPGHGRYTFSYTALSFTLPAKVRFRYQLEGFDKAWIDAGSARSASYTSLPAGTYRFRVEAENNDGIWSTRGAVVAFRIKAALYRRWWFFTAVALLLAAAVYGAVLLRERAVQRRFALVLQERTRVAREIHDTLAQDLVSIALQLDLTAGLLKQKQVEPAVTQLGHTRQLVKDGLHAARQSIWNLRASAGEDSLPSRLTQLASRYAMDGKPPVLSIGGEFRALPAPVEAEVLRIAQESLSNITRHAGATEATVSLRYEPQRLMLTVHDNGRGFDLEKAGGLEGHYGLRGMRERAGTLRARLDVLTAPGAGTTVSLEVPLQGKEARTA